MASQFFEHQEAARRSTAGLVFLFICAVLGIIALLYAVAVGLTAQPVVDAYGRTTSAQLEWWQPQLLVQVALATLAVVAGGSLYKISQLSGGGSVVAEQLGGRLLASDTPDPDARRLLNVVEEMAIASGTPTPPVYLLDDEEGINAFAAGFTPSDAVIGITRGCIRQLSREELQGVIAHEFSHILNGDMRLNIRLMGFIHGILLLGIIGYFLLRSSMFAGGGRRNSRDNSGLIMLAAGIGLMIAGFVGTFFGNLIKASVSRQREFLADASAVQFTRNPAGIAGALKKIAGFDNGSALESPAAPEASHMFFSQGLRGGIQNLFATHPPIKERIQRLDPSFVASPSEAPGGQAVMPASQTNGAASLAGPSKPAGTISTALPDHPDGSGIESIGAPTKAHLDHARTLVERFPDTLIAACREPYGARAVFYALLIDDDESVRQRQLERLNRFAEEGLADQTRQWMPEIRRLGSAARLPLVDLTLPALRRLSPKQYRSFRDNVRSLVEADQQIDLFEWVLHRVLFAHLAPHFEKVRTKPRRKSIQSLSRPCSVVLSALARLGTADPSETQAAFEAGAEALAPVTIQWLPADQCDLVALDRSLKQLTRATPLAAQKILTACAACIASDDVVAEAEAEVVRAIADSLDCPMPPLLPGQSLI
ncbi:MAG: M48 family metallopeptidase [Myxococcota bacterium]|nr:M48 family metallopeptidase [Myxococcota bacterium]